MIQICSWYTTTGYPSFRPKCLMGFRAGIWCHNGQAPHYCGRYWVAENEKSKENEVKE